MKDSIKKIKKYITIIKIAATAATVALAIYTLIPKSEKIKGIDTLPLEKLSSENSEDEEVVVETKAEEVTE